MAKEGYPFIFAFLIPTIIFGIFQFWIVVLVVPAFIFLLLTLFVAYFFRDPERIIPDEKNIVVSPADGKITRIAAVNPSDPNSPTLISIFLSPLNVHINRAPIAAEVLEVKHIKGQFKSAMSDLASLVNEQKVITFRSGNTKVVMKQIAGFIARRCVFWKSPGDSVLMGERVGLIKFSSRTDLILPSQVSVCVSTGDRVLGGTTIIGRFK